MNEMGLGVFGLLVQRLCIWKRGWERGAAEQMVIIFVGYAVSHCVLDAPVERRVSAGRAEDCARSHGGAAQHEDSVDVVSIPKLGDLHTCPWIVNMGAIMENEVAAIVPSQKCIECMKCIKRFSRRDKLGPGG